MEFTRLFNEVVVKPIGSDSIELDNEYEMPFVSRKLSSEELQRMSQGDIGLCPTFLQNYIDKKYELRITAVGTQFFSAKLSLKHYQREKAKRIGVKAMIMGFHKRG